MDYIITADTDIGTTKSINQDSFNVQLLNVNGQKLVYAILCDGMGGHEKGELASATVVNEFKKWINTEFANIFLFGLKDEEIKKSWNSLIDKVNSKILNYGKKKGIILGTTLTLLLLTKDKYFILNVGDTRAYKLNNRLEQITKDQTVVFIEFEKGLLTEEQAKKDPRRSILLQSIGASESIKADYYTGSNEINSVYILCTDGFRHEISNSEIFNKLNPDVLISEDIMKDNSRYLIDLNKERNEKDNISLIVIRTF